MKNKVEQIAVGTRQKSLQKMEISEKKINILYLLTVLIFESLATQRSSLG